MTKGDLIDLIKQKERVEENGSILKRKPLNKVPVGKTMKMTIVGGLFKINVVTFLKFGIIIFSFAVLKITELLVALAGIKINEKIKEKNIKKLKV